MILSMTGFGEAQVEQDGQLHHVEIRTVNNRYFKASIRLPEEYAFLEPAIEQLLRKRMTRGSASVRLHVRDLSARAAPDLNLAALRRYVEQLGSIAGSDSRLRIDLATLAGLPGVCQPAEMSDEQRESSGELVLKLANEALTRLVAMRETEGRALAEDLRANCDILRRNAAAVRALAPAVVEEYRERLTARVQELIASTNVTLAKEDLLKEVAIYAERSDVSEELSRLESHLEQFDERVRSSEPAGRLLDFIAQEMHRESNTIGAKAGDARIARHVIEMKAAVDRLKEQVQNVE